MKFFFIVFFITAACISCAQQKMGIVKIYAFNQLKFLGNIPVDDKGNALVTGPDTVIYIYIETTGKAPEWQKAFIKDKVYAVSAAPVTPTPVEVGSSTDTGQPNTISVGKGNKLWEITLYQQDAQPAGALPRQQIHPNEILLEGTYQGKPVKKVIRHQVALRPRESV